MKNKRFINIERILARIENDFSPDDSDWIASCAAWCVDALDDIEGCYNIYRERKLKVRNRIAQYHCSIDKESLTVLDSNRCVINEINYLEDRCNCGPKRVNTCLDQNRYIQKYNEDAMDASEYFSMSVPSKCYNKRTIVYKIDGAVNRNYVITKCNQIELNFDTDYIYVIHPEIYTYYSEQYDEELPMIPDIGVVKTYLTNYCIARMLAKGRKHPVMELSSRSQYTNPALQADMLKEQARVKIIHFNQDLSKTALLRDFFYNFTFYRK